MYSTLEHREEQRENRRSAAGSPSGAQRVASGEARPETRERILDAASRCVEHLGLRRTSMVDVAREAGLSRGSLYAHFGDRAGLVDAVLARTAARYVASSAPVVRCQRSLVDQVAEAAVFIRQHPGRRSTAVRFDGGEDSLLATLLAAQGAQLVSEWVSFWQPFLDSARARGEVREGLDHAEVGEWIVRLLLSFAVMPAVSFDADDPAAVRQFVHRYLVDGLAAHATATDPTATDPTATDP